MLPVHWRARRSHKAAVGYNNCATLEKDWNDALARVVKIADKIAAISETTFCLSAKEKTELRDLSQDLSRVWNHPDSSIELKKRIIRTVIKELVYLEKE